MAVLYGMLAQQLAIVAVFAIVCLACWYYWSHRKILIVAWKLPPILLALPIVGHGYLIARGFDLAVNYVIKHIKNVLSSSSHNKGVFWVGPYPFFFIADPEEVQIVLTSTKSFEGGIEHKFLGDFLGNGLITAPAYLWKVTRRHVNALFHPRNLDQLMPVLNTSGRDLVIRLTHQVGPELVDVEPLVFPIALKSTCKLIFGTETEVDMENDKFKDLMNSVVRTSQLSALRFARVFLWPDVVFRFFYSNAIKQIEDGYNGFILEAIQACRKQRQLESALTVHVDDEQSVQKENKEINSDVKVADEMTQLTLEDTYNVLQKSYPAFTEKDLHYEIRTILFAGSESTRITLSYCLLALAANPHIQEKLYSEIVLVTGSQDSDVTPDDIRAMPYLDQVLKETLRKFLVIPLITRRVQEDLKLNDWTVPAGSLIGILTFGVHFNPKLYPDPERFDPDRFHPDKVAERGKNSFVPFSSGPRNCIGKTYAMMAMKTILVHVLRRIKFTTTVDVDSQMVLGGVMTGLKEGFRVHMEFRQKTSPSQEPRGVQEPRSTCTMLSSRHREGRFID